MSDQLKTRKASDIHDDKKTAHSSSTSIDSCSSDHSAKKVKQEPSMCLRMLNDFLISKIQEKDNGLFDDMLCGDMKEVEEAIKFYTLDNSFWNSIGYSLLPNAVEAGLADLVKLILKHADTNDVKDAICQLNLLLIACIDEDLEITQILLDFGFDPNQIGKDRDGNSETCLNFACREDNVPLTKLLLKYGADSNLCCPGVDPPLLGAGMNGRFETMKLLLEHGAKVDLTTASSFTALDYACTDGCLEAAKLLLDFGADVNNINMYGDTPMISALDSLPHVEALPIILLLLEWGADPSIVNNEGKTAFDCVGKRTEIAKLLADAQLEHILK